jgi:hypothetical protein
LTRLDAVDGVLQQRGVQLPLYSGDEVRLGNMHHSLSFITSGGVPRAESALYIGMSEVHQFDSA